MIIIMALTRKLNRKPRKSNKGKPRVKIGKTMKRGLNTVEKKQVKNIVKAQAETKYFNAQSIGDLTEIAPHPIQNLANMYCVGFAASTNYVRNGGGSVDRLTYGNNTMMRELHLARLFEDSPGVAENHRTYAIEGQECEPAFQKSSWFIEANYIQVEDLGQQSRDGLPTLVRMLRVQPKPMKGSNVDCNPEEDVFLDQYNEPYGINTSTFKKGDIALAIPNRRRYKVIQDKMWVMAPPMTENDLDIGSGTNQVRNINSNNCKKWITMNHDLGKKYHYDPVGDDNYPNQPSIGQKNEYILFHFQHLGDTNVLATRASADDFRITCRPTGGFKDI